MSAITVRIRYAGGTLRVTDAQPNWTLESLKDRIRQLLSLPPTQNLVLGPQPLSSTSGHGAIVFVDDSMTLKQAGIGHGTMIFMDSVSLPVIPAPNSGAGEKKSIDAGGNLVLPSASSEKAGFRPGLQSLRSQKLHWTLTEMAELDNMYTFVIKGKEPLFCASVSLDYPSAQAFQQYCTAQGFHRPRAAIMFGKFMEPEDTKATETKKERKYGDTKGAMRVSDLVPDDKEKPVKYSMVECFYDPKQEIVDGNFMIDWSDEGLARAMSIANLLGLTCVGIAFSHAGNRGYNFSASEILQCGVACLEATNGSSDSPFTIAKVAPSEEGTIQMDAFQLTKTCLDMIKEEALEIIPGEPAFAGVNERYQVIVEAKPALVVDTDFFIKRVPIKSHTSEICTFGFPRVNRDNISSSNLRTALSKHFSNPQGLRKTLKDFNLLIYLSTMLGLETVGEMIHFIMESPESEAFPEGFIMMLQEISNN